MSLFSLAFRNIRLNRKKYIMYIFSMGFSVFTLYTFLALMQNEYVKMAFQYDRRYQSILLSFGVIIMVFVLFFLISSNNSFIRARKKELSTYSLFGMSNIRIGSLIFTETMMVGAVTLAAGVVAGIFFSKLMAMILLDMALSNFTGDISFTIDPVSILITAAVFIVIFCLMGLTGLRVISRFELVELFKAEKISEGKSKGSIPVLILSVLLIAAGYILAANRDPMVVVLGAIPILVMVILGTYLFFWGGLPKVLTMVKKNKSMYYKGSNLISVSAVSHRMKSIASVMATIAVLSAVAVTAIATGFTLYSNVERNAYSNIGFDLSIWSVDQTAQNQIDDLLRENDVKINQQAVIPLFEANPSMEAVTVGGNTHLSEANTIRIYSEKAYNKLVTLSKTDLKEVDIEPGRAVYAYPYVQESIEKAMLERTITFGDISVKVSGIVRSNVPGFGRFHTLILNNDDYNRLLGEGAIVEEITEGGGNSQALVYNYEGALNNREIYQALTGVLDGEHMQYRTSYSIYNESLETFGLICFIGFFMSGVFILMTASLLYFKQVMAAEEECHQYRMLRKIGLDSVLEKNVIKKRLLPVFFIPLAMGIVHSIFAMKTADTIIFSNMIPVENSYLYVLGFSGLMYGAYALVYAVFYIITKAQFERIVQ